MTIKNSGYLPTNGVTYYYEIHGQGAPLLLLHGGLGTIDMFGSNLAAFAKDHEVIAIDLHGHGRTSLGTRPFSPIDIADDVAAILDKLGYRQVDAVGYSLGAAVAFRLAVQHPHAVGKLVLVSACPSKAAFYPEMIPMQSQLGAAMAPMMKQTPMWEVYSQVAPRPDDFPKLLDALGTYMRQDFDWTADVAKVSAHTMIVVGDSDMFQLEHVVSFYKLFGGGQCDAGWMREHQAKNRLAILPDVTHYDMAVSPQLVATVLPFLATAR